KGHFINFNGTAGIWRKECILDAGNWEGDTLTEDLDLSYRAQLKNWKFKYLEDVETPAELPVVISAARSQQFRWNKGGAENFRKSVWSVSNAKNISFKHKFPGVMHLLNSSMFLCVFMVAVLSIPMMYIKNSYDHLGWIFEATKFFILSTIILFVCYWFTYKSIQGSSFDNFVDYIRIFFTFFSVALGLDRKSTRLNSSHVKISYAVFCLKKKRITTDHYPTVTLFFKRRKMPYCERTAVHSRRSMS